MLPARRVRINVRIYNRALSAAEVKALYEFEKP
jgi:hypothetical protein